MRLLIGLVLSELPFDLLFWGGLTMAHSSVMVTLLLGFCYGIAAKRLEKMGIKLLALIPFMVVADLLGSDYGGWGVAMVAMFMLTRDHPKRKLLQTILLAVLCWLISGMRIQIFGIPVSVEMPALAALVPIFCYSGKKATTSRWLQWGFYLFYPLHLTVLLLIAVVKYGYLI